MATNDEPLRSGDDLDVKEDNGGGSELSTSPVPPLLIASECLIEAFAIEGVQEHVGCFIDFGYDTVR
ncbi:MAG: hypothetical protein GDA68_22245 [Nitrospira sp. CR2.1]|nr:hypothetical protein [Nitrospira sp. CR2.1]